MTDDFRIVLLLTILGATCYWIGRSTARAGAAVELASLRAEVADLDGVLDVLLPVYPVESPRLRAVK
ncbi:MAG TPA: hypothetical protein DDY88_07175 [Actinobacteria bacterium]|nr:hypothetical protein [Actinomycetota bacterium]